MELIADKQFPDNYSLATLSVLEAMSMTGLKKLKLVGSSSIRSQLYAGDYDGFERVDASSPEEVADHLRSIVKRLRSMKDVAIGEIKCGEIPEWNVFRKSARVEQRKVLDFNIKESQSKVDALRRDNVLTAQETKDANELLEDARDEWDFLHAKKTIRHHILRWTPFEVLEGAKLTRGNRVVKLEDAVASGGMIKIDAVANIHDRFTEFSVIYDVYIKGKHITETPPPLVRGLMEDLIYFEKANPFKALKRLFSLAKHFKKYKVVEKLVPILNGDLGRLYQMIGDLKTLASLLEHRTRPTSRVQAIRLQIDEMRQRLGNIYQLKDILKAEHSLIGSIFTMLKTPVPKLHSKLETFVDELQSILDKATLKEVGGLLKNTTKYQ
jgi:hypothetical protein